MPRTHLRRIPLLGGFLLSGLLIGSPCRADEPLPAQASPVTLEFLLDRVATGEARSILLDAAPLDPIQLALDGVPAEAGLPAGAGRVWRLDLPVARNAVGEPSGALVVGADGKPTGPEVTLAVIAARREITFSSLPVFADWPRKRDAEGNRFVVVDEPTQVAFDLEQFGTECRCVLTAKVFGGVKRATPDSPAPSITVVVDGKDRGSFEPGLGEELHFTLPPATGVTPILLQVRDATAEKGGMVLLRSLVVETADGHDRAVVKAPMEQRGLELRYVAAAPEAILPLFNVIDARGDEREVALEASLLPGHVGVVTDTLQLFEIQLGDEVVAKAEKKTLELDFDVAAVGMRKLTLRALGRPLAGRFWLVQPRALYMTLREPTASLAEETGPVRGLDAPGGHPLVRHMMFDEDTRRALLLPPPSEVKVPVELRAGDRLEFSLGLASLTSTNLPRNAVDVEIALIAPDGKATVLFTERMRNRHQWIEKSVVVPPGLTGPATLRLLSRPEVKSPLAAAQDLLVVAEPTLVHRAALPATTADPAGTPAKRRPNLLIYLVDTLRADHCSPWGYGRDTTPALTRFASEGILFERAWSQAPWTRPAVATLFTSRLYSFHGAGKTTGLAPELLTLAERLHDAGYATAGFIANAHIHGDSLNFEQGFSRFTGIENSKKRGGSRADAVSAEALGWLAKRRDQPFFLYVHTIDPHAPYDPPAPTAGRYSAAYEGELTPADTNARTLTSRTLSEEDLQHVLDLYDEEVLYNDADFGTLCDKLREMGLWDDTVVLFLSDHGEEFDEHGGFGHGSQLWNELLHIPLVLKLDQRAGETSARGTRVAAPVRTLDLLPTLLERLGVAAPPDDFMGLSLAPAFSGGELPEIEVIAEEEPDRSCLISGRWKLIRFGPDSGAERTRLYDLETDPHEQHDLAEEMADNAQRMTQKLAWILREYEQRGFGHVQSAAEQRLDEGTRAALMELGYVGAESGDERARPPRQGQDENPKKKGKARDDGP